MVAAEHLRAVIESFAALLEGHFKLFKVEVAEDAKGIAVQVGKIAAFAPLLLVGYGFMCVALALFLARFIGAELAFLAVGLANLTGAGLGIYLAVKALQNQQLLDATRAELAATTAAVGHAVRDPLVTVEVTRG